MPPDETAPKPARWTEYVPLAQLVPADRNPKQHDMEQLRASMARFGFTEPLLLDERTGKLVAGHGRLEELSAAKAAGLPPPEGVAHDGDGDGDWSVPVVRGWASKDDDEAAAYLVASNRIGERGGWQQRELYTMLDDLAANAEGLLGTGFTADDLDDMLAALNAGELPAAPTQAQHAPIPDRAPPAPPREAQGLREVTLVFPQDDHREYQELLARLKRQYGDDVGPRVVLRAMREAVGE